MVRARVGRRKRRPVLNRLQIAKPISRFSNNLSEVNQFIKRNRKKILAGLGIGALTLLGLKKRKLLKDEYLKMGGALAKMKGTLANKYSEIKGRSSLMASNLSNKINLMKLSIDQKLKNLGDYIIEQDNLQKYYDDGSMPSKAFENKDELVKERFEEFKEESKGILSGVKRVASALSPF